MSFLPGWRPAAGRKRPPVPTWAGAISNFALGNTKNISCTYGPAHASRYAYCIVGQAVNANLSTSGNINSVSFDGNACTQLFLQQSGVGHASAWGVALPSGASGTCSLTRSVGNGFGSLIASCFTVNLLEDPLNEIDFTNYLIDVAADPWDADLTSLKDAVALACIIGPGPNSGSAVITTAPSTFAVQNSIFGASPNTIECCSAMADRLASGTVTFATDALGAGNQVGTIITLR
jgi:hypothetical protein